MKTLADLTAPAVPVRKVLEKDVQKQCVDWARARGYWARKFSSMTSTAEPDYLFARSMPIVLGREAETGEEIKFATEFKRPGNTSTAAQLDEQQAMRDAGWIVFECSDFQDFKSKVLQIENGVF